MFDRVREQRLGDFLSWLLARIRVVILARSNSWHGVEGVYGCQLGGEKEIEFDRDHGTCVFPVDLLQKGNAADSLTFFETAHRLHRARRVQETEDVASRPTGHERPWSTVFGLLTREPEKEHSEGSRMRA